MELFDEIKRKFIRLSRGQRKVAQFVMDKPNVVATHTAQEVGKLIGVSESTVIRFCYSMGFSGYSNLQQSIKDNLVKDKETTNNIFSLSKKEDQLISEVMNRDVTSILNSIPLIKEEYFHKAIKWMHELSNIYVLGFRESLPIASFLTSTLESLRTQVKQIEPDIDNIIDNLHTMDESSLLFVISLEPVQEDILTIVNKARKKKVKIVAITTSTLSPLREYADVWFTISTVKDALVESQTVSCSLIHALVEGMIAQNKDLYIAFQKMNKKIEKSLLETV